ncbi:hypothetical protein WUBG_16387 [Wuchereria bancrofti]|uniref:Uncharacterized protein n=1 Tax=Wuchereria bancrofti TaxID=6293 RepID=J9DSW1_WUCBA|nr:hypothetical protein WUBG_16387 [Wuchereria bancrofti]
MYILWKYSFHWVNGPINVILRTALRGGHVPTPFGPIYITWCGEGRGRPFREWKQGRGQQLSRAGYCFREEANWRGDNCPNPETSSVRSAT